MNFKMACHLLPSRLVVNGGKRVKYTQSQTRGSDRQTSDARGEGLHWPGQKQSSKANSQVLREGLSQAIAQAAVKGSYRALPLSAYDAARAVLNRGDCAPSESSHYSGDELAELQRVLAADYCGGAFLPSREQVHDLDWVIGRHVRSNGYFRDSCLSLRTFSETAPFSQYEQIVVEGLPYRGGSGLFLWGFSCDLRKDGERKFLIVLNTAHHPAVVAGTLLHEFGHYLYRSISGGSGASPAAMHPTFSAHAMHPTFSAHLSEKEELFADSVLALSIFDGKSKQVLRSLCGVGSSTSVSDLVRRADAIIDPFYRIDLQHSKVTAPWRIRYLAYKVHLFKLRKALLDTAGI